MVRKLRRIITGFNEEGKSIVTFDGPPFGQGLFEMWVTDSSPADNRHKKDANKRKVLLEPPSNGSAFRFFQVSPENPSRPIEEVEKEIAAVYAAKGASHCLQIFQEILVCIKLKPLTT